MRYLLFICFLFFGCDSKKTLVYEGWSMTMPYKIIIADSLDHKEMQKIVEILSFTLKEVNLVYNNWNESSEVSQFNRNKASLHISQELQQLIHIINKAYQLSGKRFDPTVGPISMAFHKAYQKNEPLILEKNVFIGWDQLSLKEDLLVKEHEQLSLDLCGISKGYFLDLLIERFLAVGIKNALVEWAGEVRAIGTNGDKPWSIQIDENFSPIQLKNAALATSGNQYNQISKEVSISHVIHPFKKSPMNLASPIKKVSVQAPSCAIADALATAAMTFDSQTEAQDWAKNISEEHPEITFWFF